MAFHLKSVDVVIVGAGAAGLAAAQELKRGKCNTLVLEAANRVGGRAWTNSDMFSIPIDLGCAWLHQADKNPLTRIAKELGFTTHDHDGAERTFFDAGKTISEADMRAIDDANSWVNQQIRQFSGNDRPLLSLAKGRPGWATEIACNLIGELDSGGDSVDTSLLGLQQHGIQEPNWLVKEGMGKIIESLADGVDVELGEKVSLIETTDGGVRITTTGGTVVARQCIVTVSTGVLCAQDIRFIPPLSPATLRALRDMPMGHFNKVILEFDAPLAGFEAFSWVGEGHTAQPRHALSFLMHPFGAPIVIAFAGGAFGKQLAASSQEASASAIIERLRECIGGFGERYVIRSQTTDWSSNTLFNGSYAYLRTGGSDARLALAQAATDHVHFAGEATATELAQTCGGAYLSGVRAAQNALRFMQGPRD